MNLTERQLAALRWMMAQRKKWQAGCWIIEGLIGRRWSHGNEFKQFDAEGNALMAGIRKHRPELVSQQHGTTGNWAINREFLLEFYLKETQLPPKPQPDYIELLEFAGMI